VQAEFWAERWRTGQIGFHRPEVDANLTRHWRDLGVRETGRVFVPLCGKSVDLLWLRDRGHSVVGVELSAIALEAFCVEHGIPARRRELAEFDAYQAPSLELLRGDFFALTPALLGGVAAVYDRAALISWSPELRAAYVQHLDSLVEPGCEILLITLEYAPAQMAGPPFPMPRAEVDRLFAGRYDICELSRLDALPGEPRMRARGLTELHEVCYRLTRL
jgi:thiopurine S-methyltransferase